MTSSSRRSGLPFALGSGAEFDRIRHIALTLGDRAGALGDDCALIRAGDEFLALSTDVSLEGVHFRTEWLSLEEIGWRAAAAALSDLAAEGARPLGVLAAVTVPPAARDADVAAVMDGVGGAAAGVGASVLGGDLSSGPVWSVAITVIGRARTPVTRAGAQPGDSVWVTGVLGGARAALEAWRRGESPAPAARAAFVRPEPRIRAGEWLAEHGAKAMLDLSDGLAGDVKHLAAASGVSLDIALDHVPVAPAAIEEARRSGVPVQQFAAEGGEDYELLVALPEDFADADVSRFERDCGLPLTRIGAVRRGRGVRFRLAGRRLDPQGFDHFG